jgi:endonuclease/exonuclease/phosphatase family metal-dependent hydrolase
MKKFIVCILASTFLGKIVGAQNKLALNVMTFNIRYDNADDLQNNWQYRKDFAARMIGFYNVDIVGTQEVLKNQLDDLLQRLPGYTSLGVGRIDGKEKGEYSAIFFQTQKFEVEKNGHFWLSQQPESIGSVGWDAACERIVTWAVFKEKKTGLRFAFFNTHFDHIGVVARKESALLLKKRVTEIAGTLPVILTGDLNVTPDAEAVHTLLADGQLADSRKLSKLSYGPSWSFHDFGRTALAARRRIDYIFVGKGIKVNRYASICETLDSTFLSDHNPVFAEIELASK